MLVDTVFDFGCSLTARTLQGSGPSFTSGATNITLSRAA